jgi:hypothetical protein
MRRLFLIILIFGFSISSISQNLKEEFVIEKPSTKVSSIYYKLKVLDNRKDTTNIGIIQKGAFNRKAFLVSKISLSNQLENYFKNMIVTNENSNKELILNLREFRFAEVTSFTEEGYCYIRAEIFSKNDTIYKKIDQIDVVSNVNSAFDVTKKNIRTGTEKLMNFIAKNIATEKEGDYYTFDDIINIDKIEKANIPVYNTTNYVDGIYMTYSNFSNQTPNQKDFIVSKNKKGKIINLEIERNGSKIEVDSDQIYCFIDQGIIYLSTNYGYYPLEFKDNDFYFNGKSKVTAKTGNVVVASMFFGVIGGLIASESSANFINKIDHINGEIIPIEEIKK